MCGLPCFSESRKTHKLHIDFDSIGRDIMKINSRKTAIACVAGLVLLIAAVLGLSQQRPNGDFRGGPGPRDGLGLGPFGRDLNLTEDQKTQIKKIQETFRESNKALFDQLQTLRENEPDPMNGSFDEVAV